jgi:hypothetical protein
LVTPTRTKPSPIVPVGATDQDKSCSPGPWNPPGLKVYLVSVAEIAETKGILGDRRKVSCVVVMVDFAMSMG